VFRDQQAEHHLSTGFLYVVELEIVDPALVRHPSGVGRDLGPRHPQPRTRHERGSTDVDVRLDEITNTRKPRIVLTRHSWQDTNGHSPAAIAIEWHRPPIDKTGELYFYVGVRVGDRGRRDLRVAKYLSGLAPTLRSQLGSPWERESESFPNWRWITPQGDALDETAVINEARSAAWACWQVCAEHIDEVLA
jgi:hypothetical protein